MTASPINSSRLVWVAAAVAIVAGFVHVLAHLHVPLVRNAMVYARITYTLLDTGSVVSEVYDTYGKPPGYAYLSLPWVALFGATVGMKLSSWLWTSVWLASIAFMLREARALLAATGSQRLFSPALVVVVCVFNPLVFYQFMSAYPDTVFAVFFLWAMYFLARMLSTTARRFHGPAFALSVLLAVGTKLHGLLLLPLVLIFLLCRVPDIRRQWRERRTVCLWWAASLVALAGILCLARAVENPVLTFGGSENSSVTRAWGRWRYLGRHFPSLCDFGWLTFGVLLPAALWTPRLRQCKEWYISLAVFVLAVLFYRGTSYNIRYFLPLVPMLAIVIAQAVTAIRWPWLRRAILGVYGAGALFTTVYFNSFAGNAALSPHVAFGYHDNLRLVAEQKEAVEDIAMINGLMTDRCRTLFYGPHYYGDSLWYTWERDGLFPQVEKVVHIQDWAYRYMDEHGVDEAVLYLYSRKAKHSLHLTKSDERYRYTMDQVDVNDPDLDYKQGTVIHLRREPL